jgi:hypothetical protein
VNDIDFFHGTFQRTMSGGHAEASVEVPRLPEARYRGAGHELAYGRPPQERETTDAAVSAGYRFPDAVDVPSSVSSERATPGYQRPRCAWSARPHHRPYSEGAVWETWRRCRHYRRHDYSPLQARYPELGMMSDYDSGQAATSRRELFGRFSIPLP